MRTLRTSVFWFALLLVWMWPEPVSGYGTRKRVWSDSPPGWDKRAVELKLVEGSSARLQNGRLVSDRLSLDAVNTLLGQWPSAVLVRLCDATEKEIDAYTISLRRAQTYPVYDMNLWYRLELGESTSAAAAATALNALAEIEIAYPAPLPLPAPSVSTTTPNLEAWQTYANPAPGGIDTVFATGFPGGRGQGVAFCDIEYSWNLAHEDLSSASQALIGPAGTDPYNSREHGTAVLGQLAAVENNLGVRGLVDRATPGVAATFVGGFYRPASAITTAALALAPGDVILIEQQAAGPRYTGSGQNGLVPSEWIASVFQATSNAVAAGIVVVAAAGNGGENLDDSIYQGAFRREVRDSGAIVVGAGYPPGAGNDRARTSFSCYGSRLDVQGWGQGVATTGYGDLYNGGPDARYTRSFSGTSSATSMVAAAAIALQGIAQHATGLPLDPAEVRRVLTETGSPQQGNLAEPIGPRPDLRAAVQSLFPDTDQDGLLDRMESEFPGADQTHRFLADSDGDGLPDGREDANRNGVRDPWETSPCRADTDGDRVEDGLEQLAEPPTDPLDPADPAQVIDSDRDLLPVPLDPDDAQPDVDGDRFLDGYEWATVGSHGVTDSTLRPTLGDANGDGQVSNGDAFLVQRLFLGLIAPADPLFGLRGFCDTDTNRDGRISNIDGLVMQTFFLGVQPHLPAPR